MFSRKGIPPKVGLLASFACITFVLGVFLRSDLIFASAPIVLLLGLFAIQKRSIGQVYVVRTIEKAQLLQGDYSKVRLQVTNIGKAPIALVTISDSVPFELRTGTPWFSFPLKIGEVRDEFYLIKGGAFGVFSLGPIQVSCSDSAGKTRIEQVIDNQASSTLVVLPKASERLTHFKIRPRKTKPWPGEIVARKVGPGMDNYSIRQYIPGDSYRRINWRASAKRPDEELLLNEQSAELGADTIVIVDARPASDLSNKTDSLINHSIRAGISVTDKLLRDRNRVGLVTIGLDSERIPPGYGRRQYNRIVLSLIKLRAGGFFTFENIPSYLKYFYPHLAQVILISPLVDSGAFNAAGEIARSGYELLVLSPNPVDFSPAKLRRREKEHQRTLRISIELALLARRANLDQLRRSGALVTDWRKDEPLDFALSKNVRAQERQIQFSRGKI
ncbi:MAG: DUF58 domain-containing protein [Thaumarchaeota archaeon]|nr:DUF58 domain-containing protein [Nitrososphaerota archaeon]